MATLGRDSRLVIGLTGPVGGGCSTVAAILESMGFERTSLSKPIRDELRVVLKKGPTEPINESSVPDFRKQMQDIGNQGRESEPLKWLNLAILGASSDAPLVIDGIRNLLELQELRIRFYRFFLVAVYASPEKRWERVQANYDGNKKKFLRDDDRDSGEGLKHGQQVTKCVDQADYVLNNEDDLLGDAIKSELMKILSPDVQLMREVHETRTSLSPVTRPPTAEEGHMAAGYAESHISQCLKRHVGAVVVSEDGRPLSMGYNENAFGMLPCVHKYGTCFKDDDMHAKLAAKSGLHCPGCGVEIDALTPPWLCLKCGTNLKKQFFPSRNLELCTAIHAEERAIASLAGRSAKGGTLFTTTFPCLQCARYIVDASLARVVYVEAYPVKESLKFLAGNGVNVEAFQGFKARAFNLVFRQVE